MAQERINNKIYTLTPQERDVYNTEQILQYQVDTGVLPLEGAIVLFKLWFEI